MKRFAEAGIESRPLWKPMHLQPVYAEHAGLLDGTAESLFDQGIALPSGSAMSEHDFSLAARSARLGELTMRGRQYDPVKRVLDVVVAALGLVITAPVQLVVAVLVRLKLGSPVLFRQVRPGKDEQLFELVKFRTMRDPDPAAAGLGHGCRPPDAVRRGVACHEPGRAAHSVERAARRHEPGRATAPARAATSTATPRAAAPARGATGR